MTDRRPLVAKSDVLLKAHGICKSFPGVRALNDVQITVRRGRLNALLGENGAGKTTLMNILSGVFPPDTGEILLNGQPIDFRKPHEAQAAGISTIFQELNLVPDLSVAENIFLGREKSRFGLLDRVGSWLMFFSSDTGSAMPRSVLSAFCSIISRISAVVPSFR